MTLDWQRDPLAKRVHAALADAARDGDDDALAAAIRLRIGTTRPSVWSRAEILVLRSACGVAAAAFLVMTWLSNFTVDPPTPSAPSETAQVAEGYVAEDWLTPYSDDSKLLANLWIGEIPE